MSSTKVCLWTLVAAMLAAVNGTALPSVETISPPAQTWSMQKADSPSAAPVASDWVDIKAFQNAVRPNPTQPEWNNVWYQTHLKIPAEAKNNSVWLSFQHIRGIARLYIDGKFVKELVRPDWEVNISDFVTPGSDAELRIYVTRTGEGTDSKYEDDLIIPTVMKKVYNVRYPAALGLMGKVEMIFRGKSSWLSSAWVECIWEPKTVRIHVQTGGKAEAGSHVTGEIQDATGKIVLHLPSVPFKSGAVVLTAPWKDVVPWELGNATLYKLDLKLTGSQLNNVVDELPTITFGFREVRVDGRQLLINGKPAHCRLSPIIWFDLLRVGGSDCEPGSLNAMHFLSKVGFDVLEVQPHSQSFWSRDYGPWPVYDETLIEEADQKGIGLTISGVQFTHHWLDYGITLDPLARAQYRKELEAFLTRYRNHPSILAWVGAMNYFDVSYGALANAPWGMGREPSASQKNKPVYRTITQGVRVMESVDPTRPSYAHHGGNAGTIASSNQHLCMTPSAELERWPSEWAEKGEKPWIAVEFAVPYWADFWMKNRNEQTGHLEPYGEAAITEFAAMSLGDEAYEMEGEQLRKKLPILTRANTHGHGSENRPPAPELRVDGNILDQPSVRAVFANQGRRISRAWRTWEVTGWSPWILSWGLRYRGNPETFMPDVVKAYKETNQAFLAYIGGAPEFYRRQWNYNSGEAINKSAVIIWDGPGDHNLQGTWEASLGGKVIASGKIQKKLEPCTVTKIPIAFTPPNVTEKTPVTLKLTVSSVKSPGAYDEQLLTIWPPLAVDKKQPRDVVLFDPLRESSWVTASVPGIKIVDEAALAKLDPSKTLIIMGRFSLRSLSKLPYTGDQIASGLKVIFLEQGQADLLRLGFRSVEWGVREGISIAKSSPLFKGLSEQDFRDWRGDATLLSEKGDFLWWTNLDKLDPFNPARGARWGTHGNVTSVQIETPHKGSFLPLMRCGFDMAYTPLLEWRHGNGAVWFCQLDFSGRVGSEPAATFFADRLINYAASHRATANRTLFLKDVAESQAKKLKELGFSMSAELSASALNLTSSVLGDGISGFELAGEKGSNPPAGREWKWITRIAPEQVKMPESEIPPPNLRRFRLPVKVTERTADQAILGMTQIGEPLRGYIGVPIDSADGPYVDPIDKDHARLSRWRTRQLYGWMFTESGVDSSADVVGRMMQLDSAMASSADNATRNAPLLPLQDVKISQSIQIPGLADQALLDATNLPDLKFRDQKTVSANKDAFGYGGDDATGGYIDLAKLLDAHPAGNVLGIVTARINVPTEKELTVRIGADYKAVVTLNGSEILRLDAQTGPPSRDAKRVRVKFKAGDNILLVRVVSGSLGFGCWLDVDDDPAMTPIRKQNKVGSEPFWGTAMLPYDAAGFSLYTEPMRKRDDPYAWKSW